MKILVVDDEVLLVKGIKFNLESEGYSVDCCYDGEAAVAMARENAYDHKGGTCAKVCHSDYFPKKLRSAIFCS